MTGLLLVLLLCLCSCFVPVFTQPLTDAVDIEVLKSLSDKYSIQSWAYAWTYGVDPCGSNAESTFVQTIKCVCTYNNGSTCHVVRLQMFAMGVRGTFPMDVFNLKYLTYLDFGENFLHGPLPRELGNATGLSHFSMGSNLLTGPIPKELGKLKSLTELYLDSNYLSGEIPMELSSLSQLSTLWLFDNNFSGPFPDIFGNTTNLTDMRIYGNNLQGPIPTSIQKLTSIKYLYIGDLKKGGYFPKGLSSLHNLTILSLRNNGLTGSIPADLGTLSGLITLDLSFNVLTGSVPSSLGNIPALSLLYLGSNNLTGPIPSSLFQSKSLQNLDLSFNQLEGNPSLWDQSGEDIDMNPVWNSFNGSFQIFGRKSALPLLDCAQNIKCAGLTDENSNFAINAGGATYSTGSVKYDVDNQSSSIYTSPSKTWLESISGETTLLTAVQSMKGSEDTFLFISARKALSSLRYLGLGMSNGAYTVELQFAEIAFDDSSTGRRIFDVYIQGTLVLKDFNIQEAANGSYKAIIQKFSANIANNVLDIHFFWAGKGTCCIPTGYQDYGPLISAIRVYSGSSLTEDASGHPFKKTAAVIASVCVGAAIFLVFCLFFFSRRKWKWRIPHQARDSKELVSFHGAPTFYSYNDMRSATNDFHPDNKLGQGGFGAVYKGVLQDGSFVAIKELSAGSMQGQEEFMNEVTLITGVQHRNLVKLKGCCLEGDKPVLVYEYLQNKSLDKILFEPCEAIFLDWPNRFNIIVGIARGLAYLHEESQTRIIHRDIKASNILLDKQLQPKIADFGVARLFVDDASHVTTRVAGTRGYMAPEYVFRGQLTVKADVYSFGIVVLEIISGRRNRDSKAPEEQEFLVDWAWDLCQEGCLLALPDLRLNNNYTEDEILRVIHVALLCVMPMAQMRPTMTRAISMLLGDVEVGELPSKPDYFHAWGKASKKQNLLSSGSFSVSIGPLTDVSSR